MKIAIDGPAGAGKTTVAREIARRLNIKYLDTGAMYRAVTLKALKTAVDMNNEAALKRLTATCNLEVRCDGSENIIYLDGEDVTGEIRSIPVNKNVSIVARSPGVRKALVPLQRKIAEEYGGIVMEGRDIGSNVLVNADYKIFLSASVEARACRRWNEMKDNGLYVPLEDVIDEICMRDRIDQGREEAPLTVAAGAEVIDTTAYALEEVIQMVLEFIRNKETKRGSEERICCDEGR